MKRLGLVFLAALAASAYSQEWIPLQDGKSLAGWKAAERPESWVVEDGAFVTRGERSHLFYVGKVARHDFKNFELSLEVMTAPGSNSGVYVHTKWQGPGWPSTGYEMQVINSNPPAENHGGYVEHKMTGSIYAVRNIWEAPATDNEWFNYRIRVVGKTIQTFVNDRLICEYAEPANAPREQDKIGRVLGSGTFALQAHDPASVVKYRNIKVKILPVDAAPPAGLVPLADVELDQLISKASNDNVPLIELVQAPADLAAAPEEFWRDARLHGVTPMQLNDRSFTDRPLVLINDVEKSPDVEALKKLKASGFRIAFISTSGRLDEARLKRRLQAIRDAGLGWKDFWVPGKP